MQTLDYDYHISKGSVSEQSEPMNQEVSELNVSDIILEPSGDENLKANEITEEESESPRQDTQEGG